MTTMPPTRTQTTRTQDATMVAVTLVCADRRNDVLLPATLPIIELLPGMTADLDQLTTTAATYGFQVRASSGRMLNLAQTLAEQHVAPGTVLTLTARTQQDQRRYDDLTEAVGLAVESVRTPWGRTESTNLSVTCACLLAVTAAILLALRGQGGLDATIAGIVSALIVGLAAGALARTIGLRASVALTVGACALLGAAGWNLTAGASTGERSVAAALGIALVCACMTALPRNQRPAILGPLAAAACLAVTGLLVVTRGITWTVAAGTVAALTVVISAVLPSIGLAFLPVARLTQHPNAPAGLVGADVTAQVGQATLAVTALRAGLGIALVAASPLVTNNGWHGAALLACCAASLALGMRSLYGRIDVLTETVAAFAALLIGAVAAVWSNPWLALLLAGVMVACVVLLVLHTLTPDRYRPGVDRAFDVLYLLATVAVIPFAVVGWMGL